MDDDRWVRKQCGSTPEDPMEPPMYEAKWQFYVRYFVLKYNFLSLGGLGEIEPGTV